MSAEEETCVRSGILQLASLIVPNSSRLRRIDLRTVTEFLVSHNITVEYGPSEIRWLDAHGGQRTMSIGQFRAGQRGATAIDNHGRMQSLPPGSALFRPDAEEKEAFGGGFDTPPRSVHD